MIRQLTAISIIIVAATAAVAADSTACIYGRVLDFDDGQPVVGARILIRGTEMGTMIMNLEGNYIISDIPPGKYQLNASCLGYNPAVTDSFEVNENDSLAINFILKSESMEVAGFYHGPPLINKYETSVITHLHTRDIERLPVKDLEGILKYNAGIMASDGSLHIRGSRAGDVGIIDDGVFIRDQLGGH